MGSGSTVNDHSDDKNNGSAEHDDKALNAVTGGFITLLCAYTWFDIERLTSFEDAVLRASITVIFLHFSRKGASWSLVTTLRPQKRKADKIGVHIQVSFVRIAGVQTLCSERLLRTQ